MKKSNYSLPKINPPKKDKAFSILSKIATNATAKTKSGPKDKTDLGKPTQPKAAAKKSVKQFK